MSIETAVGVVVLKKKVLVVEDRKDAWDRIRETFTRLGDLVIIVPATTIREARECLHANPDVVAIALDYGVPEDEGGDADTSNTLALADEIRETFKGRIIAMGSFPPDREKQMRHGCSVSCTEKGLLWQEVERIVNPQRAA